MKSPFTGKEMMLIREKETLPYRKDEFEIFYHSYECIDTKERFTDDELDFINISQIHNLYREKYGLPFPEEIKAIREKYGISARKMSEILGLGPNTYRLYEGGEMPSVSNGRLIISIKDPEEFRKQIKFSSHLLKETEKIKLLKTVDKLIENAWNTWRNQNQDLVVNESNGFRLFNLEKVAQVLAYFHSKGIDLFKTKVNKFLFYADFLSYRNSGRSMLGLTYRAIPYGPVPCDYEDLYKTLFYNDLIDLFEVPDLNYTEKLLPKIKFEKSLFNDMELGILERVSDKFKNLLTNKIVEISHKESAWIDNQETKNIISYKQYAFNLKAFE